MPSSTIRIHSSLYRLPPASAQPILGHVTVSFNCPGDYSSLALNGGGRIFHSPSSLIFPACSPVLSDLLRDSLCTALQTEKLWIWSTGLSTLLTPSWRYLPIRNHDNRSSADWIRLCPGLSKNSEDGNSCSKPHKAARLDWSCGKSGQHWDWDYQSQYGFYQGVAHGFTKENELIFGIRMDKESSCGIGMRLLA